MTSVLLGFLLALAESGVGLGAIVPGELAISALATGTHNPVATMVLGASVALGATAGDHLGYLIGRHGGSRLRDTSIIARVGVGRWDRAADFVQRYGFWAMFVSRLVPVIRTVMPFAAGSARLRYPVFLLASILGAVSWSALWVGAGAGVATSGLLDHPEVLAGLAALIVIAVMVRVFLRRRKTRSAGSPSA